MQKMTCQCCGKTAIIQEGDYSPETWDEWYCGVYLGSNRLGDICRECAKKAGVMPRNDGGEYKVDPELYGQLQAK